MGTGRLKIKGVDSLPKWRGGRNGGRDHWGEYGSYSSWSFTYDLSPWHDPLAIPLTIEASIRGKIGPTGRCRPRNFEAGLRLGKHTKKLSLNRSSCNSVPFALAYVLSNWKREELGSLLSEVYGTSGAECWYKEDDDFPGKWVPFITQLNVDYYGWKSLPRGQYVSVEMGRVFNGGKWYRRKEPYRRLHKLYGGGFISGPAGRPDLPYWISEPKVDL